MTLEEAAAVLLRTAFVDATDAAIRQVIKDHGVRREVYRLAARYSNPEQGEPVAHFQRVQHALAVLDGAGGENGATN